MKKSAATLFMLVVSQCALLACVATAQTTDPKIAAPVYHSDCAMVHLRDTDSSNMTQAERIAAEENALFEALDENRECNTKALASGQQAVSSAAQQGNGTGGPAIDATAQQGSQDGNQNAEQQQDTNQVISTNTGEGGAATGVNGAEVTVCQISRENLAASTTPEDKTFWQQEVLKNCSGN